jgi:hypothetical protein
LVNSEIYRERLVMAPWVSLLFGFVIGIIAVMVYVNIYFGINLGRNTSSTATLFGVEVFLILVYLVFMRLDISIDPERVEVRFGIIRKTIPIEEIVSCEPTYASFTVYGGVGIRYGIDGSMAFTTSFGDAVKIKKRKGRSFVFSTNGPIEVLEHINRLIVT